MGAGVGGGVRKIVVALQKRIFILMAVALLVGAGFAAFQKYKDVQAQDERQDTVPIFVYNSLQAPGWWSPGSYPIQSEEQNWPEGLGSSITVFDSGPGEAGNCHVSAFHWNKLARPEELLSEREEGMVWN